MTNLRIGENEFINFGPFRIDHRYRIWKGDTIVSCRDGKSLGRRPVQILGYLIQNRDHVVNESELGDLLGQHDAEDRAKAFRKYLHTLRSSLKPHLGSESFGAYIETVRKVGDDLGGYRFIYSAESDNARKLDIYQVSRPETRSSTSAGSGKSNVEGESPFDAQSLADYFNAGDRRTIGAVIETHPHPFLNSLSPLSEKGWSPDHITLRLRGPFDSSEVIANPVVQIAFEQSERERSENGLGPALRPPNGAKFAVRDLSTPYIEAYTDLEIALEQTDYFSIMRCLPGISRNPALQRKYGSTEPMTNRVPHSFCLHFTALFNDGRLLVIHRSKDTPYCPNTWSFSAEEQCAPVDLQWDESERMRNFMLRAAAEEILPFSPVPRKEVLAGVLRSAEGYVRTMRIWSVVLEGPIVNFDAFGVFELSVSSDDYSRVVRELVSQGVGLSSREGAYFSVSLPDARSIVKGQSVAAIPLFGGAEVELSPTALHPTTPYRLTRLLESMVWGEGAGYSRAGIRGNNVEPGRPATS